LGYIKIARGVFMIEAEIYDFLVFKSFDDLDGKEHIESYLYSYDLNTINQPTDIFFKGMKVKIGKIITCNHGWKFTHISGEKNLTEILKNFILRDIF
jgi:hypothetical protein